MSTTKAQAFRKKRTYKKYPKKRTYAKKSTGYKKYNNAAAMTVMSYPMPQKCSTQLTISFSDGLISALTSSHALVYRPTSYFDVDPVVGGGSYAGYAFFAGMYSRYRVTGFAYEVTFTNLQAQSVMVGCQGIPSVTTPNVGTATDYTEMAAENEFGTSTILAPTSATPTRTLKGYINTTRLWGTPEVKTDNDWAGAVGASPAANSWLRISAHMLNNAAMTIGVQFHVKIKAYGYWDQKNPDLIG